MILQEPLMAMVPPARLMLFDPAVAVSVPPQELAAALGVATTTFAGSVSVNATPLAATGLAAGLVSVKLSVETPVGAINTGLKALLIVGGRITKMLADAVPPVTGGKKVPLPLSKIAVTALVVLSLLPPLMAVTLTENEQLLLAVKVKEFIVMVLLPGVAEMAAEQVPVKPLGEATTKPLGKGSLNEVLSSSVLALGLLRLKVKTVVPPTGIVASAKAFAMVGG